MLLCGEIGPCGRQMRFNSPVPPQQDPDLFITNDRRLQGKTVPGIQFITALDQAPL